MFRRFYSPESDPPHKIMRYWFYYSIWLGFSFPTDRICQLEMICTGGVPVSRRHFGGAGPQIFYMIHRGGRTWQKRFSSFEIWTFENVTPSGIDCTFSIEDFLVYCKCNNYRRNGNVVVPWLFIYSGGKQGGNYLEWRSRKKVKYPAFFFANFFFEKSARGHLQSNKATNMKAWLATARSGDSGRPGRLKRRVKRKSVSRRRMQQAVILLWTQRAEEEGSAL